MDRLPPAFLRGLWSRFLQRRVGVHPLCRVHWRDPLRPPCSQSPDPSIRALRPWRPVAVAVLVCFSGLTLEPWQYLLWWKSSTPSQLAHAQAPAAPSPEAQLAQLLKDLETQGRKLDEKIVKGQDATPEAHWFGQAMSTLSALGGQMQGRFKEIEKQIAALPAEIHLRHQQAVLKYEQSIPQVQNALNDLVKEATPAGKATKARSLADLLQQINPQPQPIPLDPHNLPVRSPEATPIPPRTTAAEYALTEGIKLASANPEGILLAQATTAPPTAADLAETIEVQFTPEIQAKAAELNHHPVQIYNWVRNTIEFVPTYGSIQGAQMCLLTRQCNAFDTASLLIALLRVSGIHARYEYGTIEIPIEKIMNWVGGFTNPQAALQILAQGGIPVKGIVEGGALTKVQMEHVWVEAWIDMIPSQGAVHKQGDTWVPLDASFKQYRYVSGIDLKQAVPFDANGFLNQLRNTAVLDETIGSVTRIDRNYIDISTSDYSRRLKDYILTNYGNKTGGDIVGKKTPIQWNQPIIFPALPYKTAVKAGKYSEIPQNLRHRISFAINDIYGLDLLSYSISLPETAIKRIALCFSPATQVDEDVIRSYFPSPSLPAYLINLKPELIIDGQVVSAGPPVQMGSIQNLLISFTGPVATWRETISNRIIAGEYRGIGLNLTGSIRQDFTNWVQRLHWIRENLSSGNLSVLEREDIVGQSLEGLIRGYFYQYNLLNFINSKLSGVVRTVLPSMGMVIQGMSVAYLWGVPYIATPGGISMDVDRLFSATVSEDSDKTKAFNFSLAIGIWSSILEHIVPEQFYQASS